MAKNIIEFECRLPHDGADTVTNLREDCGALVPVGAPATLCEGVAEAWPLGDGLCLCVDSSRRGLTVCGAGGSYRCGSLSAALDGVVGAGEWRRWLLTADGPQLFVRGDDGRYALAGSLPGFGSVRLWAEEGMQFAETVSLSPLTGGYVRGSGALTADDSLNVGADLRDAYRRMKLRATLAGQRLQPSLMAWQLVDDAGQVIFRSVPQWMGAESGFQLIEAMTTGVGAGTDGKFSEVDSFIIKARGWRPAVGISVAGLSKYWIDHTAKLELIAAPAIEFTDREACASGRLDATASGHSSLRLFMPGAASGMTTDIAGLMELTASALARFHQKASVVVSVPKPFSSTGSHTFGFSGAGSRLTSADVPADLQLPHHFSATTVFESGSATFMAGLTVIASAGSQAADVAVAVTSGPESVHQVALTLSDGSVLTSARSCALMPASLPPLMAFPLPGAIKATLLAGGEVVELVLKRSACGRYSYWQSASLSPAPWTPTATGCLPMAQTAIPRRMDGTLLCARSGSPLTPLSAHGVCSGRILRITQAVGSAGGWNYGRQHLTLWGTEGVYALSVDRSLLTAGCSLLHRQGVARADAVAVTPRDCRVALSSGRLLTLTGARAQSVCGVPIDPVAAGWCAAHDELWLVDSGGSVGVLTADGGFYRRSPLKIARFCSDDGGRLWAVTTDGCLTDCSRESPAAETAVEWSATTEASLWPQAMAVWHLDAESASLTLALEAGSGGAVAPLCTLAVKSQINAPLVARVYSPRRAFLTARISGTLTALSSLSSPARLRRISLCGS